MMASICIKCFSLVNFLLFWAILQKHYLISIADNCVTQTFASNQKIVVDYFSNAHVNGIGGDLCTIILQSNGLISIVYHISSHVNAATCIKSDECINNRMRACYYKMFTDQYNKCDGVMPALDTKISDCVCAGSADDVLLANDNLRKQYKIDTLPALVVNGKYDPCFNNYSYDSMRTYFCKAYNNALPVCQSGS